MRPILFELFGIAFPAWHVFFALAGVCAYAYCTQLFRVAGAIRAGEAFPMLFVICYAVGWFGARALSIFVEQFDVTSPVDFLKALFSYGPMTFYGGAIAAFGAGLAYALARRAPVGQLADACLPAGALALGVGRIGCFLNGDDYGAAVLPQSPPPWWAVTFPNLRDGVARYPVQLEEALFSFLIAGIMGIAFVRRYRDRDPALSFPPGFFACLTVFASATHRFGNEFFRGDARGRFFATALSTSQGISLLLCLSAMVTAVCLTRWRRTQTGDGA